MNSLEKKTISNIRTICMECIVKSGHPGIALGAAPIMHTLYTKVLKQTSKDSDWFDRDRFILAAGHGSILLYTALHLSGYKIGIEDLKKFRQLGSITPGHPEYKYTDGIDATSGPLGQGIAMACGMAFAEKTLANRYNKEGFELFNHYTYVLCGDGDLQEGVTVEALSLIGHLKLNKIIIIHDSNDIQLDGKVSDCMSDNLKQKVESMGLKYFKVEDGENTLDLLEKIEEAKKCDLPAFIEVKTIIGYGAKTQGTEKCHGAPLPIEEANEMRKALGGIEYEIFSDSYTDYKLFQDENYKKYQKHCELVEKYKEAYPDLYNELYEEKEYTVSDTGIPFDKNYDKATRYTAGAVFNKFALEDKKLIGGSADLALSVQVTGVEDRRINFGVREHAMGAIVNGIILHSFTRAFCSGFLVFSDYMKPAIRMAALMNLPAIYSFSHDTIAVGEDGPTHQPIEQITTLRSIPNLNVIRPCGQTETKEACVIAMNSKKTPTFIVCTRQNVKEFRNDDSENLTLKGAYVISGEKEKLDAIMIASGSEVELAVGVQEELFKEGIDIRVVSMPSIFLFEKQSNEYKEALLPNNVDTFALEMSEAAHLYKYIKGKGKLFNINEFGVSGKASDVIKYFGFTKENITNQVLKQIK